MKPAVGEAAVIAFSDGAAFDAWLDAHVDLRAGVWLKIAKKGSGVPSLTDAEAVDLGLCHGWISGQRRALDEVHYLQKYVPRRPRSRWSRINVARVEELIAAGRMRPSGLAEVEAAKADGRWAAAYGLAGGACAPVAGQLRGRMLFSTGATRSKETKTRNESVDRQGSDDDA